MLGCVNVNKQEKLDLHVIWKLNSINLILQEHYSY
jgi:hypothetical protein